MSEHEQEQLNREVLEILDEAFENSFGMKYSAALDDNSGCYVKVGPEGGCWMSPQVCANIAVHIVDNLLAFTNTDYGADYEFDHCSFNDWVRELIDVEGEVDDS